MQIEHIRIKNPNWLHQLVIYKRGRGFVKEYCLLC